MADGNKLKSLQGEKLGDRRLRSVPLLKMNNIGTGFTYKIHNKGTVPTFKMHNVGILIVLQNK